MWLEKWSKVRHNFLVLENAPAVNLKTRIWKRLKDSETDGAYTGSMTCELSIIDLYSEYILAEIFDRIWLSEVINDILKILTVIWMTFIMRNKIKYSIFMEKVLKYI